MCIYIIKKQNFFKNSSRGYVTPSNVQILGVSVIKDTAKSNTDLGMSCYIHVGYSVFFR